MITISPSYLPPQLAAHRLTGSDFPFPRFPRLPRLPRGRDKREKRAAASYPGTPQLKLAFTLQKEEPPYYKEKKCFGRKTGGSARERGLTRLRHPPTLAGCHDVPCCPLAPSYYCTLLISCPVDWLRDWRRATTIPPRTSSWSSRPGHRGT